MFPALSRMAKWQICQTGHGKMAYLQRKMASLLELTEQMLLLVVEVAVISRCGLVNHARQCAPPQVRSITRLSSICLAKTFVLHC